MSAAVACGENSVLDTSRNGIDVEADGSMSSIEDGGEIFPPFSRIDVTSILSPPLIKVEDDNDDHDNETLRAHKRLVHAGEEHKCTICFQKFLSKHMLTYHLSREHVGQSRFTCDICTRKFGYEDIFMNHCRQHNGSKPFYCPLCNTWFCDLVDLNSHAQEFQVRDPIHCSVCGQRTARKYKLLLEKLSGTIFKKLSKKCLTVLYYCEQCQPKDTHDCAVCGRIFVHPGYLRQHYNSSHRSVEPFKCGECFASFTSRCILERHLETHPGRQRPWVCPFCGLRFQLQSSYMSHLQDHKALKPYSCSICGENFNIEKKLNVHITEHHTIGENESSSCSVISSSAVSDGRNDCLNGEYETSVSNDICLGDTQDVSDSERHVINTSAQKRYKSCAVSFMQKETLSNAQECTSNILGGGLKLNRDSIDTVLQNSNPTHSLQYVKQEVLYDDCDCTTIQEYRNSDVNKDYSKHTVSNTSNHTENRENIFSFDYVKEEVFTPDVCATVQEDRNVNKSVDSCQTECSIPLENSAANCAVYFIKKEVVQNVDNVPSREHFDLTSPGSTNATMLCSDFNSRQKNENDNPGFSLSCLKTETVSEEENNTTFKSFTLNQERQNSMQHQGDEYFYHVGVKEELCSGEGRDGDIASGEEEDEEFCPLDLLSTELTLRNEESPDAENSNSLNECNEKMRLLISDVKSVPSENHSPTCEADMENECSDEEGRDEIEFKTSTSPKLQTCEFGPVAESSSAEPSKQFSISRLDQKIPMEVQLPQIPALPAMSPDSTGLDSFQR
ncbi:hypothetical protein PR048_019351 [Dryococelus australis]|uniref:C2H2-type domain-containing protein n=1 Tax=Dryococelus australis TaxID=614101 RepID=A0ABQ9H3B9_9NEOP|nr:hypothetical protein PR048_019351 [Dryococelus australis]